MKYYIIAGEASGDLHASNLMRELKNLDYSAIFRCWGGDLMESQGGLIVKHYRDLAFMGFLEVILNLRTIAKNLSFCKKDILEFKPDVLILVDYPGFNLRIAEFAHQQGIRVFYYISPQVWAWKKSRVKTIKKVVDKMFVILPFEKEFYKKYNYDVDFVGHPLIDALNQELDILPSHQQFLQSNKLDNKPIIALLPGSRKQEIATILKIMIKVIPQFTGYQFVIAGAPSIPVDFYKSAVADSGIKIIFGQTHNLLRNSEAALVTSGTATLETALLKVPQVVCYKGNPVSFEIARRIVDVKYISLVNLIADQKIVQELVQYDLTPEKLSFELNKILKNKESRSEILEGYDKLEKILGGTGASAKTARLMVDYLGSYER